MLRTKHTARYLGLVLPLACTFGGTGVPTGEAGAGASATTGSASGSRTATGPDGPDEDPGPSDAPDSTDSPPSTDDAEPDDESDTSATDTDGATLAGQSRLAVQYYLDEVVRGDTSELLLDSASEPHMDLGIDYSPQWRQPVAVGEAGRRGLAWESPAQAGIAFAPVGDNSKIRALLDETAVTFELVLDVTDAHDAVEPWGRVFGWQQDSSSYGMEFGVLTAPHEDGIAIDVRSHREDDGGPPMARLPLDDSMGRFVLHVVFDSQDSEPDRLRLYVDGERQDPLFVAPSVEGEGLQVSSNSYLLLGNRRNGDASFAGTVFYAALYAAALTDEIVLNNAIVLAASDDP